MADSWHASLRCGRIRPGRLAHPRWVIPGQPWLSHPVGMSAAVPATCRQSSVCTGMCTERGIE
jgi:hypothetical protein